MIPEGLLKPIADGCPDMKKLKYHGFMCPNSESCYFLESKKGQLQAYGHHGHVSADLIKAINECMNLQILAFNNVDIDEEAQALAPTTQLQNLTALQVLYSKVSAIHHIVLTLFVNTLPRLTYIGILYALDDVDEITNTIILNCPLLTHLDLEGNAKLTFAGLRNIGSCKVLKYLDVSRCIKLDDQAMKFIAEGCPELENLDLSLIYISDAMFRQILRCKNLKTLLMRYCDVNHLSLNHFSTNIPGLMYLYVGHNLPMSYYVALELTETMPNLVIKEASFTCDGSEYLGIKTSFVPRFF
jgi:hypothetical protein